MAEILNSLVPLMNDVGIEAGWRILHGSPDFFGLTKKIHNALQGGEINLTERKKSLYLKTNGDFAVYTHIDHDCVIIHDPQPLPLIRYHQKHQPWIWRCHIDLSEPHRQLWDFLKTFVLRYDLVMFSSKKYLKEDLPVEQKIIYPAIDPLSYKNMELDEEDVMKYVKKARIPTDKPVITQVSRMDKWKDPEGLLEIFQLVRERVDCRLVYCYNSAIDDPESMEIHARIHRKAKDLVGKGDVVFVMGNNECLVNAVQRFSTVVVQKSTREGFCLAVTEALWKGKPVVASDVGGIPLQIVDGETGFLVDAHDKKTFADRIVTLLKDRKLAAEMGAKAREAVRKDFLITRLLLDYLGILESVLA